MKFHSILPQAIILIQSAYYAAEDHNGVETIHSFLQGEKITDPVHIEALMKKNCLFTEVTA